MDFEYIMSGIKEESDKIINNDPEDLFVETHQILLKCESCSAFYDSSINDKSKEFIDFTPILICQDCQSYFNNVKTNFICVACNNIYEKQHLLENHQKLWTTTVSTSLKCPKCMQPICTTKTEDLMKHLPFCNIRSMLVKRAYICYICNGLFDNIESLKIHTKNHFKCNVCFKVFKSIKLREKHTKTHEYAITVTSVCYVCQFCNEVFKDIKGLEIHTKNHLKCIVCSKAFKSRELCKKHEATHAKKIINCTICNVCFNSINLLKIHASVHTDCFKDKYKCSICSSKFENAEDLKRHYVIHKTIKTYSRNK